MTILHEDVVADILSRLPVKSLIRFKCVCKAWFAIISNPQFAKLQLQWAKADSTVNLQKVFLTTCPFQTVDYEAFNEGENSNISLQLGYPMRWIPEYDAEIVGSCDGLVLIVLDYENLLCWNPTTRDSKELPKPNNPSLNGDDSIFYGLGYDSSINDYKVVRGVISAASNGSEEARVQVLELKTNSWRGVQYPLSGIDIDGPGTISNSTLHWVGTEESDSRKNYVIISFDLTEKRFEEVVPLTDYLKQNICIANLRVSRDCLVIFCYHNQTNFEAWEMKDYGVKKSWSRLFSVSIDTFPVYEYLITPVGFTKDGKVMLDIDGRDLILYNTKEETFRNFVIQDDWDRFEAVIYEVSLVSPNAEAEASRLIQAVTDHRFRDYL